MFSRAACRSSTTGARFWCSDPGKVWIGLEYFCYDTDELWRKTDQEMIACAVQEAEKMGIVASADVLDATVLRMEKTYPAYFGTYDRFPVIRDFVDRYRQPVPDRPQRHAQVQQSGSLHAHGDDGGG